MEKGLIDRISMIARLELTDKEKKKFEKQLKDILEAFKRIDEVDTKDVEPSFHPIEMKNAFREDEVKEWKWDPLGNTKHKEGKNFKGPRIV